MVELKKIWSSSQLPTLPTVAIQLLDLSKDPETEIRQVADVIKTDPAICAKILKATNSSYFGFQAPVTSIDRAVPLLGTTVVTSLALSFSLVEDAMTTGPVARHYRDYWMQSIVQAATAELLSEHTPGAIGCEFFLCGLLSDLGRLAMLKTVPEESCQAIESASERQCDLHHTETEIIGINHVEVGVKLMQNWNLPPSIVRAAQFQHDPPELIMEHASADDYNLIRAIATAASFGDYFCGANKGQALTRLRMLTTNLYGFDDQKLDDFVARAKEKTAEVGELFSVNTDDIGEPEELMALANEHLATLTLRQQMEATQAVARQQMLEEQTRQLESKNEELQKQVMHDPLTKVYNRSFFDEAIAREVDRCGREAATIGLLFLDIDKFKTLNDNYGHQFGDQVLQQAVQHLSKVIRKSDVLARYGGEEFVVLVSQPTERGIAKVAERLRAAVEQTEFMFEGSRVPVTVSIGAAMVLPARNDKELVTRLVAEADEAMYDSKENGRNQVHVRVLLSDAEKSLLHKVTARRFSRWLVNQQVLDIPRISQALLKVDAKHIRIGVLAQQRKILSAEQVEQIREEQSLSNERFGQIGIRLGLLNEDQLADLLAIQSEDPQKLAIALVSEGLLSREHATQYLRKYLLEAPRSTPAAPVGV
ncbi:sensor domain-containing diguanylate cyclase [Calycomorphotria hydatis]|uniref:diguanylate cyclase n=1 Tax=Calycomorphotria hydatis TaxID=2528027 RepID=A0A517TF14_9PLAN|nr:GGDEF domain-containing protein [Calycomorphotria hydatis]QDT66964.1 Diguanylate cyclase DosC [Calycomorphotria hydatis]